MKHTPKEWESLGPELLEVCKMILACNCRGCRDRQGKIKYYTVQIVKKNMDKLMQTVAKAEGKEPQSQATKIYNLNKEV